jgi:hypothetical protein
MDLSIIATRRGNKLDPELLMKNIQSELNEYSELIRSSFKASARTWDDVPEFIIRKSGEYEREIYTANQNYARVNRGTSVRYATMSPDFLAKSQANSLTAGGGAGGVQFIDRNRPRPGIKARNFDKEIKKLWSEARFALHMRDAVDASLVGVS